MAASYTLAELQGLAREYNRLHTPIALKQSKVSLHAQLEQHGVFEDGEEERVAKLVEAVAREGAVWALKLEDWRRFEERREKRRRKRRRSPSGSVDSDGT